MFNETGRDKMSQLDSPVDPHAASAESSSQSRSRPQTMQAIVYHDYGPEDILCAARLNVPKVGRHQVLIRVHASGVNPIDARLRRGEMKGWLPGGFPRVPGYDVAGVVVEADSATRFVEGDRVMAFLDSVYGGGYAEYAVCSASAVAKLPSEMPFEEAAALPLAASTALQSLRDHAGLKPGQRVLINGASGGVGAFAVQIAQAYGAQVTGVASHENEAFVRSLGAISFIDYESLDFTELDRTWDIVFDVAGNSSFLDCRKVLTENGRYVSTEPNLKALLTAALTTPLSQKGGAMLARSRASDLEEIIRLYNADKLKVTIEAVYPLADAVAAHRHLEKGVGRGKIVLRTESNA